VQRPAIGIVDGLPVKTIGIGHDGSDDVDQLRQTSQLHAVGIADQSVEQSAHQQRVFQVVNLFQQMGHFLPVAVYCIAGGGAIPDIPLVEREPQLFGRPLVPAHHIANRGRLGNLALHAKVHGEIFLGAAAGVAFIVAKIAVQRQTIDVVVALLEHFAVPFQISWHEGTAGAAGDELQRSIHVAHLAGSVGCFQAVFRGRHVSDLPRTIHLVAQAPVFHAPGIRDAMLPP